MKWFYMHQSLWATQNSPIFSSQWPMYVIFLSMSLLETECFRRWLVHHYPTQRSFKYHVHTILFSLASSTPNIKSQELKTTDGHLFSLITLDPYPVSAFESFRRRSDEPYQAVKALQKGVCSGTVGDLSQIVTTTAAVVEALGVDSEDEEVEEDLLWPGYSCFFYSFSVLCVHFGLNSMSDPLCGRISSMYMSDQYCGRRWV